MPLRAHRRLGNCTTTDTLYFYWLFCFFLSKPILAGECVIADDLRTGLDDSFANRPNEQKAQKWINPHFRPEFPPLFFSKC